MREATEVLRAEMTVRQALEFGRASEFHAWPVCDERGVIGVVSMRMLETEAQDGGVDKRLDALADEDDFPHVHEDHSLHLALERMGATQLDVLPVVHRADVHKLQGIVVLQDVLAAYGVVTSSGPGQSGDS
jgi:CIC family chloride channel protein